MATQISTFAPMVTPAQTSAASRLQPLATRLVAALDGIFTAMGSGPALISGDVDSSVLARIGRDLQAEDFVMYRGGRRYARRPRPTPRQRQSPAARTAGLS